MTAPIPADPEATTAAWLAEVTGCDIDSTQWIGIDFGLSGHCCRVVGRGREGEGMDVVVKLTTEANAEREIAFYRHYAPETPIATPLLVGGEVAEGRGYVVLETVTDAIQGDVLAGTTREGAEAMARTLARLHGRWWGKETALEPLRRLSPPERSLPPRLPEDRLDRFLETRSAGLSPDQKNLISTLGSRLSAVHETLWETVPTLVHTDAHLDNVLWSGTEPVLIDWEGAMVGPAEIDVARLLIEGMTPAQYDDFGFRTLEAYRSELSGTGSGRHLDAARLAAATLRSLAGIVGWLGGDGPPPPGRRTRRLGRNALVASLAVYESLSAGDDL